MLTIGRFADATGLTVKALRHYAEIGLLRPAHVDPASGYRFYEPEQIEDGVTIRRLRALELPLDEIRELLDAGPGGLRERLVAHGFRVAEESRDKQSLLIELSALVEGGGEPLAVEVRAVHELRLAGMIRHLALVDPEGVTEMLHTAWQRLGELGVEPVGPPTAIYRSADGGGRHLAEAGFPVGESFDDALLRVNVYPAAARAAVVDHRGSYDGLHVTAQRFIATVLGRGFRFVQPLRVEYVQRDVHARLVWPVA